jgi:uncharacterized protein DUF5715
MSKRVAVFLVILVAAGVALRGVLYFRNSRRSHLIQSATEINVTANMTADAWNVAVEKVKAERGAELGGNLEIPPELKHYDERYWFLATQVAEIEKHKVHTCQDYLDLARMLEQHELVPVAAVTETYILYGIGQRANEDEFTHFISDTVSLATYDEIQLANACRSVNEKRSAIEQELKSLRTRAAKQRGKTSDLQRQISAQEMVLQMLTEEKNALDEVYGRPDARERFLAEFQPIQNLAKNFNGRAYDLNNPSDRYALKVNMLSAVRPEALKIIEQVAAAYHQQFDRPLPVSSLVRPEQYQRALRRVNRNAVTIDTPPHSTGLAFDIDYRYMSVAEQNFLMGELARLKNEGRIEVIRERNANYHVFAFIDGRRPSDNLISASLEKAGAPTEEQNHSTAKPAKVKKGPAKARQTRAKGHQNRRRHR